MAKKVLVVDDERDIVRMLQWSLKEAGHEVISASSGREALEKIYFEQPNLVVLDIMLPELDGFGVLQKIRETPATASLPVIMLTALDETADVNRGWKSGADLYITKPFEMSELVETVQRVLAGDTSALPPGPEQRNF